MARLRGFSIGIVIVFTASLDTPTLTVDVNAGADYTHIQSVIDAAADGDTVLGKAAEYAIADPINLNRLHKTDEPGTPPVR